MEVESFENEEVAKLLNDWFVSIKVSVKVVDYFWYFVHLFEYLRSNYGLLSHEPTKRVSKAFDLPYFSNMPVLQVDREERPDVDKVNEIKRIFLSFCIVGPFDCDYSIIL